MSGVTRVEKHNMLQIRPFQAEDWPALWPILQATIAKGDAYAFSPDSSEAEIYHAWIELPQVNYVATRDDGVLVGGYMLKPNQPGLGSHVCNCGYVVAEQTRGQGIAAQMCAHSQELAQHLGYHAMQFNFVVSSNLAAVHLWQKLGFSIVGTLPGAFAHTSLGYVDAHVMFKQLEK